MDDMGKMLTTLRLKNYHISPTTGKVWSASHEGAQDLDRCERQGVVPVHQHGIAGAVQVKLSTKKKLNDQLKYVETQVSRHASHFGVAVGR